MEYNRAMQELRAAYNVSKETNRVPHGFCATVHVYDKSGKTESVQQLVRPTMKCAIESACNVARHYSCTKVQHVESIGLPKVAWEDF